MAKSKNFFYEKLLCEKELSTLICKDTEKLEQEIKEQSPP
jgi:hypothetical protein